MKAKLGALYSLTHKKANLMGQIRTDYERLYEDIRAYKPEQDVDGIVAAIQAVNGKIAALDQLSRQIAFLEESGYQPDRQEAEGVALENSTIARIAELIVRQQEEMSKEIVGIQAQLMDALKYVREGQKSIIAYFPPQEEQEGRKFDALR